MEMMKCVKKLRPEPGFVELCETPVPVPADNEVLIP